MVKTKTTKTKKEVKKVAPSATRRRGVAKKEVKKPASSAGAPMRRKKPTKAIAKKEVKIKPSITQPDKYWETVGRRKTAVARIRLFTRGEKTILVNNKPYNVYFPILEFQQIIQAPLQKMKCADKFQVSAMVKGGGLHSQAEAIRHGISRALTLFNPDFRKRLKKAGYLTRDSRMRERKKFGLKRARRAPQWHKR